MENVVSTKRKPPKAERQGRLFGDGPATGTRPRRRARRQVATVHGAGESAAEEGTFGGFNGSAAWGTSEGGARSGESHAVEEEE